MEDNDNNIILKMRMKYVEDLEEILECPICMDLPSGDILTCLSGHNICRECKARNWRQNCPTCQSTFNGSRNYLAEKIAAKFEDIKNSLLEPNHYSNKRIVHKSVEVQTVCNKVTSKETQTVNEVITSETQTNFSESSIDCQTDFYGIDVEVQTEFENFDDTPIPSSDEDSDVSDSPFNKESNDSATDSNNLQKNKRKDNLDSKMPLITCFIKNCKNKYSTDSIVNHIKLNHKENIKESIPFDNHVVNDKYHTNWTFNYEANKSYDYAINIFEIGLIFFNISIDEDGNVHGNIRIAKSYCNQQQIYYLILIGNDDIFLSEFFKGTIPPCTDDSADYDENIYVDKSIFSNYILDDNRVFECSLTLYKPEM